jgi:glycerophosphoryl diester phosphodiesterase
MATPTGSLASARLQPSRSSPRFTVIGHRGARGHAPENTLLSIDTAIRLGAHWIEIDVQHHGGELWLMHDLTLDRTTNGRGMLSAHDSASLRRLRVGRSDEGIPTLRDALDLVEQRVGVNIELKSWNGCAAAVAACLRDYLAEGWPAEQFMVSSFHLPELWEFKELLPEVPLGVLYCGVPLDWAGIAAEFDARALIISAEFVDKKLIADAHARERLLYVYTVNKPAELKLMRALGVDGVFTDFPDRALRVP